MTFREYFQQIVDTAHGKHPGVSLTEIKTILAATADDARDGDNLRLELAAAQVVEEALREQSKEWQIAFSRLEAKNDALNAELAALREGIARLDQELLDDINTMTQHGYGDTFSSPIEALEQVQKRLRELGLIGGENG